MDTTTDTDNSLMHYGVKGMRWGVRRTPEQLRRDRTKKGTLKEVTGPDGKPVRVATNKGATQSKQVAAEVDFKLEIEKALRTYGPNVVSNQDLNAYMTRVDLERRYADLQARQYEASKGRGRKMVESVIKSERDAALRGKPGPITRSVVSGMTEAQKSRYRGKHR